MKFMRYAVGEIVLVVLGILIALQINNWNEERVERDQIREFALNLADALQRDLEMLEPVEMQIRIGIRQGKELANYVRGREAEDFDNAEVYFLTHYLGYRPYAWNRAALDQLKAAGGLRKMKNQRLVQLISDYDALTQHLDQDYREDEEKARSLLEMVIRVVDRNYDIEGLEEITDWEDGITGTDIDRFFESFRETDVFRQMAALERPLLSRDPVEIKRLANMHLQYSGDAEARPDIEFPRLRGFAEEILALIDEEYR